MVNASNFQEMHKISLIYCQGNLGFLSMSIFKFITEGTGSTNSVTFTLKIGPNHNDFFLYCNNDKRKRQPTTKTKNKQKN